MLAFPKLPLPPKLPLLLLRQKLKNQVKQTAIQQTWVAIPEYHQVLGLNRQLVIPAGGIPEVEATVEAVTHPLIQWSP